MNDRYFITTRRGTLTKYNGNFNEKHIIVPSNISYIKSGAFSNLNVEEITLGEYTFEIEEKAFVNCPNLTTINFPENIANFAENTFVNCPKLKSIIIGKDDPAFEFVDGLLINKVEKELCYCCPAKEDEVTIPDNVEYINDNAFSECNKITTLKLSNNTKKVTRDNLNGLTSLETLYLSQNTEELNEKVLSKLENLKEVKYYTEGDKSCIDGILYSNNKTILRYILPSHGDYLKLEPTLERIYFDDIAAKKIKTLYVPKEIKLHDICYPSDYCLIFALPLLEHFVFEDKKSKIYLNWFVASDNFDEKRACERLLKYIRDFYPSQLDLNIRKILLNDIADIILTDTSLDEEWKDEWISHFSRNRKKYFEYLPLNKSLLKLFIERKLFKLDDIQAVINIFNDRNETEVVASLLEYENKNFTFEEVAKKQQEELFVDTSSMTYIKKSWSYKIREDGNVKITGYKGQDTMVIVPSTIAGHPVVEIGDKAFSPSYTRNNKAVEIARNKITSIVLADTIKYLGVMAFANCKSLSSVEFPPNMNFYFDNTSSKKKSFDGIFQGCPNITKLVIPEGVQYLGENFFEQIENLEEVVLPSTLRIIDSNCFSFCPKLTTVRIPSNVDLIKNDAFGYRANYRYYRLVYDEYKMPETIESVKGSYAERFAINNGVKFKEIKQ